MLFLVIVVTQGISTVSGQERVPWTTSRIQGSPEPPLPYVPERALHQHTFAQATELDFIPGTDWALVMEQRGRIYGIDSAKPDEIVQLAHLGQWNGGNVETYSIAFHPQWERNHFVYVALVDMTRRPIRSKIVRFVLRPGTPPELNISTYKSIIEWDTAGHKGGDVQFGPDGYLYIAIGDGEVPAPPDPKRTGQDLSDLDSSILRIDVDVEDAELAYAIPSDNPFVATADARSEVWAYGLRNPWKMSFDPRDGALWVGDVGWELWEMIFRIDHPGFNGGWSIVEGPQAVHPDWPAGPTPIEKPAISHSHSESLSITGGILYRGDRLPELRDAYIYGDWGTGKMWALWWNDGKIVKHHEIATTPHRLIGFAEDAEHELYYMDHTDGGIYRLAGNPALHTGNDTTYNFPRKLSATGVFASTGALTLAPGVYDFDIAAPMWNDHATSQRAVAFPDLKKANVKGARLESPEGAVFARTISLQMETGNPASQRRIETQLLHFDGIDWRGYSYRWNESQTDADLVEKDGAFATIEVADGSAPDGRRLQKWRFHSRAECIRCHQVEFHQRHGNLNAFTLPQLTADRDHDGDTELKRLVDLGLIEASASVVSARGATLVDPHDTTAPLGTRARSYLHSNCSHCHRPGGTGAVTMYWPVNFKDDRTGAFNVPPVRGDFGIANARIVAPGRAAQSTILYRMLTTGTGRMPAIGSHEVDERGALLVQQWIDSMPGGETESHEAAQENTAAAVQSALDLIAIAPEQRQTEVMRALQTSHPSARDLFQRFLPSDQRRKTLGLDFDSSSVLALPGDRDKGHRVFFDPSGPQCFTCHQVDGKGRAVGPDLSNVRARYDREQLLQHIAKPNAFIDEKWKLQVIEMTNGKAHTGFVIASDAQNLHLLDTQGVETTLSKEKIRTDTTLPTSLMPEGSLQNLTAQEVSDLLQFLSK